MHQTRLNCFRLPFFFLQLVDPTFIPFHHHKQTRKRLCPLLMDTIYGCTHASLLCTQWCAGTRWPLPNTGFTCTAPTRERVMEGKLVRKWQRGEIISERCRPLQEILNAAAGLVFNLFKFFSHHLSAHYTGCSSHPVPTGWIEVRGRIKVSVCYRQGTFFLLTTSFSFCVYK